MHRWRECPPGSNVGSRQSRTWCDTAGPSNVGWRGVPGSSYSAAMMTALLTLSWRTVGLGVAAAYGISFLFGVILFVTDITPQSDPALYPLLALLSGAIGVAVALRVMRTTRPLYLVVLGLGFWIVNGSSVLLDVQSFTDWLDSGAFVATTVIAGRLLLGTSLDPALFPLDGSAQVKSPLRSHLAR